jgi:acyl-CoA synthetase (NDP forming)
VSSNDLLEWWEDDPATDTILLYLESFGNPRRFGRLARRVARRKPILALKAGTTTSGQRAASSHTAALAGSEAAVDALFHQAGVIRAQTLEELVDVATLLATQPRLGGRHVAVLTNAGGLGILCADACEAAGLELPALADDTVAALRDALPAEASVANPVDMLGGATQQTYATVLPHLLSDTHVDAAVVLFVPAVSATADEVAEAVDQAVAEAAAEKPVLAVIMSAEGIPERLRVPARHVAPFAYPESAARALGRLAERAEWLRRPHGAAPALEGIDHKAAESVVGEALEHADDAWLEPAAMRRLLLAYGIPLVEERIAQGVDEAVSAAAELGLPVVVKSAEAGVHKTEIGGVALDLRTNEAVRAAAERIGAPVLVQPMIRGGAELLAGVVQDPVFGPLVAFGPGGVLAELIGEAAFRIAPLTDLDAEELVLSGKAGTLVRGFRDAPPASVESLVDLVLRLAQLGEDFPQVAELDLNPVLALPDRCVAVDARIRIGRPVEAFRAKTW